MSVESSTKRELETNGNGQALVSDEVAAKKLKLSNGAQQVKQELKGRLSDSEVVGHLKRIWNEENGTNLLSEEDPENDSSLGLHGSKTPFRFIEVKNLLEKSEALIELQSAVSYDEKLSDLFHFKQSPDLLSLKESHEAYPIVQSFKSYFTNELLPAMMDITGINLNGNFDIFASQYQQGDFLLCHDDELEDRRIAFILYMSKSYEESFGGTLDLYNSIDLPDGKLELPVPHEIVESITPEFNKLVFFEVSARSFHQVREVIHADADRKAISGWFYGEPLARPAIILPEESYQLLDCPSLKTCALEEYISPSYLDDKTLAAVNATLSENSEIMLQAFFKPETLKSISNKLKMSSELLWENAGPPNLQSFKEISLASDCFPKELEEFFLSSSFLQFLERLTEFPFASESALKFRGSLKMFSAGSYTLVRGKSRHQPTGQHEEIDLVSDSENEAEVSEHPKAKGKESEPSNGACSATTEKPEEPSSKASASEEIDLVSDSENEAEASEHPKSKESEPSNGSSSAKAEKLKQPSTSASTSASQKRSHSTRKSTEDSDCIIEEQFGSEPSEGSDASEEDLEPNHVDVIMYFTPTLPETTVAAEQPETQPKWEETWGGTKIYTDDFTGDQLVKVCPEGNTLAVVVRDESISSHYTYINCLAKNHYFYALELDYSFPQNSSN